jgi:hypothetical protein
MKHIIICLGVILSFFTHGHAIQIQDPAAKKSEQVLQKMRQIDLLNQIIPLALQKDQIGKLLDVVERARAKVIQIEKEEATTLAKLDGELSDAIKKSEETMVAPPKSFLDKLANATQSMSDKRAVAIDENTDSVEKVFNDICNAGQKKAAANSLAPQLLDPSLKPDKMTQAEKVRFFIREILLDPQAHEVLIELQKHAS